MNIEQEFDKWFLQHYGHKYGEYPQDDIEVRNIYFAGAEMMREKAAEIAEGVPNEWKAKGWVVESSASSMSKDITAAVRKETGK